MRLFLPFPLDESTFIDVLLRPQWRTVLFFAIGDRALPREREICERIGAVAPICRATPDQLGQAIVALEAETSRAAQWILLDLLHHPDVALDVLQRFAHEGRFLSALGHRGGPRELLEALANEHALPEAITTLALKYYGANGEPVAAFRAFAERHRGVVMLGLALARASHLDPEKRAVVVEVFGDPAAVRTARRRRGPAVH